MVDDPVAALCARARDVSVATARLLEAIVAVAADARPGFDADEVAFALAWTQSAARSQVEFGRYLTRVLPDVFAAPGSGIIDARRAWVFTDVLGSVDDTTAAAIADVVLPAAAELTTSQLRDRLRRAVLKTDPDAAGRTVTSVADRHVAYQPDRDGTASLFGVRLPAARATAAFERIDAFARGRKHDGDARSIDQLRADTFLDLLQGVGIGSSPVHRGDQACPPISTERPTATALARPHMAQSRSRTVHDRATSDAAPSRTQHRLGRRGAGRHVGW